MSWLFGLLTAFGYLWFVTDPSGPVYSRAQRLSDTIKVVTLFLISLVILGTHIRFGGFR